MEEDIPEVVMERLRERIRVGLKATNKFTVEMTIQSLYDQRAIFAKLIHAFNNDGINTGSNSYATERLDFPSMTKFYTSTFINNLLRHFHFATENLGVAGDLKLPDAGLFQGEKKKSFLQI